VLSVPVCATVPAIALAQPSPPSITTVLPDNTPGLVCITLTPEVWQPLKQFSLFNQFLALSDFPFPIPFLPEGMDFATDVQPWLGEQAAIALLPATSETDSVASNTIFLAGVRDNSSLKTFVDKLRQKRGQPQIEREYQGVTILQWAAPPSEPETPEQPDTTPDDVPQPTPSPSPSSVLPPPHVLGTDRVATDLIAKLKALKPDSKGQKAKPLPLPLPLSLPPMPSVQRKPGGLAIALLPGHLAVASQAETLEQLINPRSKGDSLAKNPLFQRTLQNPQFGRSLLVGYSNVAEVGKLIATLPNLPTLPIPIPLSAILRSQVEALSKTYNTTDFHLWLQPEGVRSQSNAYYVTPRPNAATVAVADANQVLNRLPSATYLSANSRNFKQQWQDFTEGMENDLFRQLFVRGLRQVIQNLTSLDLEKELVPWMDGEYAFFLFPTRQGLFNYIHPQFNLGIGLMLQTSDRAAAEVALKKVDRFIQTIAKNEVKVVSRQIKKQPITSWEGRERGQVLSVLAHGWLDPDLLILTTGTGPITELSSAPLLSLPQSYPFATAIQSLPTPNQGYFYVNTGALLAFVYGLVLPQVPQSYAPIVQQIQALLGSVHGMVTTNSATSESQRVDALMILAPARRGK
jgi:hypothetical protein